MDTESTSSADATCEIAIIGAGPIGLEAALYARYLGYSVRIYEQGRTAEHLARWQQVQIFSPFGMNRSSLALAALAAQDPQYQPPADDAFLTGAEYREQYLLPLAQSDLVSDSLCEQTTVVAIGREQLRKTEQVGQPERADSLFRILLQDEEGKERYETAHFVIDASGTFSQPNWLGEGGVPALGERACREQIEYGLPDLLGDARGDYLGRSVLLIGSGYSAATSVVALAELAEQSSVCKPTAEQASAEPVASGHVTWITRSEQSNTEPITPIENDALPYRAELADAANRLALAGSAEPKSEGVGDSESAHSGDQASRCVSYQPGTHVESIAWDAASKQFEVTLGGKLEGVHRFDRVIANVGYEPDWSLFRELQVHQCYASEGPMKLAACLAQNESVDCLDQLSTGPESLLTSEPNFFIIGSKSYGRSSRFLISNGLEQVRDLFTLIGERADLDLYATASATSS